MPPPTILQRERAELRAELAPAPMPAKAPRAWARLETSVSPRWCATRLSGIAALLVGLHVWIYVVHYRLTTVSWSLRCLFDLDEEQGFGTWFSSLLLLATGLACLACSRAAAERGIRRAPWRWFGPGFVLLSCDEVAGFHEIFNTLSESSWAIPAAGLVLVCGVVALPALLRLPRRTALGLGLAGCLYFGGAVGVELFSDSTFGRFDHLAYALSVGLEEGLEMLGAIAFLTTALVHLAWLQADAAAQRLAA